MPAINIDPSQVDQLVAMGQLSPALAGNIKANMAASAPTPDVAAPPVVPATVNPATPVSQASDTRMPFIASNQASAPTPDQYNSPVDSSLGSIFATAGGSPFTAPLNRTTAAATITPEGKAVDSQVPTSVVAQLQAAQSPGDAAPGQLASDQAENQPPNLLQQKMLESQNALKGITDSYTQQQNALSAGAAAAAAGAKKSADALGELYQQSQVLDAQKQQNEANRQEQLKQIQTTLQQKMDDYANMSIDPNKANVFVNGSTGQKIGAGIALALGGIGSGLSGQPNLALQVINTAIDRDIDAQKNNIQKAGNAVTMQSNVYHDMLQTFGDERAAEAATKATLLQTAQIQLQQYTEQYKAPQLQANAAAMGAELERQKQQNILQLNQGMLANQALMQIASPQGQNGGPPAKLLSNGSVPMTPNPAANIFLSKDQKETFVPGLGFANTKENAEKASETAAAANESTMAIDALASGDYGGILNSLPFTPGGATQRAKAEVLRTFIIGKLKDTIHGKGVLNETTKDLLENIVGNPNQLFSLSSVQKAKLQEISNQVKQDTNSRLKSWNLNPLFYDNSNLSTLKPNQ